MKSYLHRIASNVIDPSGPIRPVLQPIFSAPGYGSSGGFVGDEAFETTEDTKAFHPQELEGFPPSDRTASDPTPGQGTLSDSDAGNSDTVQLRRSVFRQHSSASQSNTVEPQFSEPAPIQPLLAATSRAIKKEFPAIHNNEIASTGVAQPHAQSSTSTDPKVRPIEPRRAEHDEQPTSADYFRPLISGVQRSGHQDYFPNPSKRFSFDAPARAKSSQKLADHAAQQPDEIQIHIGRIEVTAVTSAPSRPVARTAPKPLTLDEYLKRSDRRGL